ncbi:hypothetical protein HRG_014690 [Hirsutella rhossiliensis]
MSLMNSLPTTYGKNLTMAPTITLDNGEVYRTDQTIVQQKSLQPVTLSTLLYNEKTLSTHSIGSIALKTPVGRITFHILQTPTQEEEEPQTGMKPRTPREDARPSRTGRHTRANNNMCLQAKDLDDHKYNAPALRSSISATFKSSKSSSTVHLFDPNTLFSLFSLWPHFWASGLSSLSCSLQRLQPQRKVASVGIVVIHCTHLDS